ncbi:MAG: VWA domain-containing protein, partial [bacterium]|nr:VWA domain-containing protein [bacterium]
HLAAAGPVVRSEGLLGGTPERVVVLLDRSLSMTAVDSGGERFERAKSACARYLKLLPAGTPVDLVAFDDRPRPAAESVEPNEALAALGGVEAGLGGTDLASALEFAASRLESSGGNGVAALFSDLPAGCFDEPLAFPYPLLVYPVGISVQNGGIAELGARNPLPLAGAELELTATVTGPPRDYRLSTDGEEVSLVESASGRFDMGVVPVEPGWTVIQLTAEPTDAFGVDDVARLAVLVHPAPRVFTLGDVGLFGTALDTAPGLVARTADAVGADVLLWNAQQPLSPAEETLVKERLDGGAGLMIAVPPEAGLAFPPWTGIGPVVRREAAAGYRLGQIPENEVTRPLAGPLGELTQSAVADRIAVCALSDEWRVLVRYSGGEPALACRGFSSGRLLLWMLPYRLQDGTFAATEAFPSLFNQALRFCAYGEAEPAAYTAGRFLTVPASGAGRLTAPDGGETVLEGDGPWSIVLDQSGVWRLESDAGERMFAVNAPTGEGDLSVLDPGDYGLLGPSIEVLTEGGLTPEAVPSPFPLWRVLLALAVFLLLAELALADARWN